MCRIKLIKLMLRNFKGIRNLEVSFNDITNIRGDNGSGKTTIHDAFNWLLFDKDSLDRQSFEIKTLDVNNEVFHGLEHEVCGILNVNGKDVFLKKIFKEKWVKKKGEADRQLTGHETLYYVNEIPVKQSEYKDTINKFISEQLFKLLCNPLYFSMNMKWQERRNVIMDIIGDIPTEKVLNYNSELSALGTLLIDIDLETLKKSLNARKRKLNEDIKSIPIRIDELNNSVQEFDFNALEYESRQYQSYIMELEEDLLRCSKVNEGFLKDKSKLYELLDKIYDMEYKAKSRAEREKREIEYKITGLEYEIKRLTGTIEGETFNKNSFLKNIDEFEAAKENLRAKWHEINGNELIFDEKKFTCPTCHRAFDEKDIEAKKAELIENFKIDKDNSLKKIRQEGISTNEKIDDYKTQVNEIEVKIKTLEESLYSKEAEKATAVKELNSLDLSINLEKDSEHVELKAQASELEKRLVQPEEQIEEMKNLKIRKVELSQKLDECKKKLNAKEQNDRIQVRVKELLEEEKSLAKQIAELEKKEFLCEEFIKTKVELMETSINKKFKYVKFKLFSTLVNGAVEDCCEALIHGVPFSNANKAAQINAGLDIINALCSHYGVQVPIFIDNRESINEILECDSQVTNLIVSRDKKLVVEGESVYNKTRPEVISSEVAAEVDGPGF